MRVRSRGGVAEKSFETIDLFEGEIHVLFGGGLVGDVEVDGEDGAHCRVGLAEVLRLGLGLRGQRQSTHCGERENFDGFACGIFRVFYHCNRGEL